MADNCNVIQYYAFGRVDRLYAEITLGLKSIGDRLIGKDNKYEAKRKLAEEL